MEVSYSVVFPCGYSEEFEIKTGAFDLGKFKTDNKVNICPLHGKNCYLGAKGGK